jgi:hypothetical protein
MLFVFACLESEAEILYPDLREGKYLVDMMIVSKSRNLGRGLRTDFQVDSKVLKWTPLF